MSQITNIINFKIPKIGSVKDIFKLLWLTIKLMFAILNLIGEFIFGIAKIAFVILWSLSVLVLKMIMLDFIVSELRSRK